MWCWRDLIQWFFSCHDPEYLSKLICSILLLLWMWNLAWCVTEGRQQSYEKQWALYLDATMSSSLLWSLALCTGCQGFLVVVAVGEANIQVDQHPLRLLIWNSTADIRPALSYWGNAIMSKRPEETAPAALVSPPWLQTLCVFIFGFQVSENRTWSSPWNISRTWLTAMIQCI